MEAANALEAHIRRSGLRPGDRYITAKEAGRFLGKSAMTAQRAMTLLAQRNLLERRPKAGTFIADAARSESRLKCIHILLPEQFMGEDKTMESYWERVHDEIAGMRLIIPHLSVQFNFIPHQDVTYAREIIEPAHKNGLLSGVALVLSSRAMRSYFNTSGIPTVVEGSTENDLESLCWMTWDQKQIGYLLTRHLISRGHRRLATVMRDVWSVGEHHLHDGVGKAIAEAGLFSNALRIRSTPSERPAALDMARLLLTEEDTFPTGILCRNELQASCVTEVSESLGLADKIEVVLCNVALSHGTSRYTCIAPEISSMECGKAMGLMFDDLMAGRAPKNKGIQIGVKLVESTQK